MTALIYLFIFLIITFSIGRKVILLFKLKLTKIEEFLISTAIGSGVLMYLTFFLGIFQLLYKEIYLVLVFIVVLFSLKEIVYFGYLLKTFINNIVRKLKPTLEGILLGVLFFIILINLLTTFAPVFEWDSVAYHLAFASDYKRHHSLIVQPSLIYTFMPQGMTLIYTIGELFYPGTLAVLIAYFFNVFGALGIYSIINKKNSEVSALISSLIFLSIPVITERLNQPHVDLSLTFIFICSTIIFLKYIEEKNKKTKIYLIFILSLLTGISLFIKFTAFFLFPSFLIGFIFDKLIYKRNHPYNHIFILVVISFILASPWLIRSYTYSGNPVYPYAYNLFGGKYLGSHLTDVYSKYHVIYSLDRNLKNTLFVLWNMTFKNESFDSMFGISPWFITIIPLILFFYKDMKNFREWVLLFIISSAIMIIIFLIAPNMRYFFPALALMSILVGMIIDILIKQRILKWVILTTLTISLLFNFALWYGINSKNINFLVTSQTKDEYHSALKNNDPYVAMEWVNKNTPKYSKILLVRELRGYYLDRDYLHNNPSSLYINYYSINDSKHLINRLRQLNVSHILINEGSPIKPEIDPFINITWSLISDAVSRNMTLVYNKSQILIYKT